MRRWILVGTAAVIVMALLLVLAPVATASACADCKSPGYYKTHDCWTGVCIGGQWYPREEAQALMKEVPGDKSYTLFRSLVAAKLNVANGCYASCCVLNCMSRADCWLAQWFQEDITADSWQWQCGGECLYWCLDRYNNS